MITPDQQRLVVLAAVIQIGGAGKKKTVLDAVADSRLMKITESDKEHVQSKAEPRWRVRLAYERTVLAKGGFIDASLRDNWRITNEGFRLARALFDQANKQQKLELITPTALRKIEIIVKPPIQSIPGKIPSGARPKNTIDVSEIGTDSDKRSLEGEAAWKISKQIERDPTLARIAKSQNRAKNGGIIKCESCNFADHLDAMFDAHHKNPLAAGRRDSRARDLIVLCPTCHRWAHRKADSKLTPVPLDELKQALGRVLRTGLA
jgi:hypothetical protein